MTPVQKGSALLRARLHLRAVVQDRIEASNEHCADRSRNTHQSVLSAVFLTAWDEQLTVVKQRHAKRLKLINIVVIALGDRQAFVQSLIGRCVRHDDSKALEK